MAMNIPGPLLPLFDQGLLDEVLRPLMSGKEASVYLVQSRGMLCVAKVYKDAQHRSFRQRSAYAEGRQVRNTRERRAMQKGSGYGKSLLEGQWQNCEVDALYRLYDAGVRVPIPYHHAENVLLMELVADANGNPAPRLYDMSMTASDALLVHEILIREVVRMLCAGLVHGDLSEYNILIGADGPVIIDLPQATDAANNRNSEMLLLRDVANLAAFLGRAAPSLKNTRYGPEIWDLYKRAELHPESELTGKFATKVTKVDTRSVIAEIQASEEEAQLRPLSAYQLKKQKKAEQVRAAKAAEDARRAAAPPESDSKPGESKRNRSKRDGAKRNEPRRDEPRRSEPRRDRSTRDESRRTEPKRDESRRSEPRRDQSTESDARRGESKRTEAKAAPRADGAPTSDKKKPRRRRRRRPVPGTESVGRSQSTPR